MNCATWRKQIIECGAPADARSPQMRAHLAECAACAAAADEQERLAALLADLRTENLLNEVQPREAAARIENQLIAVLRAHHTGSLPPMRTRSSPADRASTGAALPTFVSSVSAASSGVTDPTSSAKFPEIPQRTQAPNLWRWGAVAAGLLLALGLLLRIPHVPSLPPPPRIPHPPQTPQDSLISVVRPAPANRPIPGAAPPKQATANTGFAAKTLEVDSLDSAANSVNSDAASPGHPAAAGNLEFSAQAESAAAPDGFMELLPGSPAIPSDGSVVLRVRMPISAVEYLGMMRGAPLGMPVLLPQPQARGFVQADLLVGADGVTRAIRFVE